MCIQFTRRKFRIFKALASGLRWHQCQIHYLGLRLIEHLKQLIHLLQLLWSLESDYLQGLTIIKCQLRKVILVGFLTNYLFTLATNFGRGKSVFVETWMMPWHNKFWVIWPKRLSHFNTGASIPLGLRAILNRATHNRITTF